MSEEPMVQVDPDNGLPDRVLIWRRGEALPLGVRVHPNVSAFGYVPKAMTQEEMAKLCEFLAAAWDKQSEEPTP